MPILVTGCARFMRSHICIELLRRGYEVIVADDYSNGSSVASTAVRNVSGGSLIAYEVGDFRACVSTGMRHSHGSYGSRERI
jgi:UDP-glucose 4-epimerase